VSDSRLPAVDSRRLLGYIERYGKSQFEVLWMTDPVRWGYFDTFAAALGAFDDSVRFTAPTFDARQIDQFPDPEQQFSSKQIPHRSRRGTVA
jgi:hypothetical protein